MRPSTRGRRWVVVGAVIAVAAALLIGVPFLYTQVIADDAPDRLSVPSSGDASGTATATPAAGGAEDGTWVVPAVRGWATA